MVEKLYTQNITRRVKLTCRECNNEMKIKRRQHRIIFEGDYAFELEEEIGYVEYGVCKI